MHGFCLGHNPNNEGISGIPRNLRSYISSWTACGGGRSCFNAVETLAVCELVHFIVAISVFKRVGRSLG